MPGTTHDWLRGTVDLISKELGHDRWYVDANSPEADRVKREASEQRLSDSVYMFVIERCEFNKDLLIGKQDLYDAYKTFCQERGVDPEDDQAFDVWLRRNTSVTTRRGVWHGISLV